MWVNNFQCGVERKSAPNMKILSPGRSSQEQLQMLEHRYQNRSSSFLQPHLYKFSPSPPGSRKDIKRSRCFLLHFHSAPAEEQEVDLSLDGTQSLPLGRRQIRVPDVHDEDEPVTVGLLPNLVLEGVVENENFTFLPLPAEEERPAGERCARRGGGRSVGRYLVWSVQRIRQPCLGTTRPRCMRSLQLVGPVWGHTWVPGCMTENLICKQGNGLTDRRRNPAGRGGATGGTNLPPLTARRLGEPLQQRARLGDALAGGLEFFP